MADRFLVASSATSTEEIWNGIGNPVYPPAKLELERHGLSCDGKRAVQLQKSDYAKYDLFVGMDGANIRNMPRIFGGDSAGKYTWHIRRGEREDRRVLADCTNDEMLSVLRILEEVKNAIRHN